MSPLIRGKTILFVFLLFLLFSTKQFSYAPEPASQKASHFEQHFEAQDVECEFVFDADADNANFGKMLYVENKV